MTELDPLETIEFFRDSNRAREEAKRREAMAWRQRNESLVNAGKLLVQAGMDQFRLRDNMWETTASHIQLLKKAGIQGTGKREDRVTAAYDKLDIASTPIRLPGRLYALVRLQAKGDVRGRGFHDAVDVEGLNHAIQQFTAPDICGISIFEREKQTPLLTNWLDTGGFTSFDPDFSDRWTRSSHPFGRYIEFHCPAERGVYIPNTTLEQHPMTRDELVYGAGLWAVHTAWVKELEHYTSRA